MAKKEWKCQDCDSLFDEPVDSGFLKCPNCKGTWILPTGRKPPPAQKKSKRKKVRRDDQMRMFSDD